MLYTRGERELARRGEAMGTSEARQMLEYAIEVGRGGVYLKLTPRTVCRVETALVGRSLTRIIEH